MIQQLDRYRTPTTWHPGTRWLVQFLWFCLGAPLLCARWLPGSPWRVALLRAFGAQIGSGCRLKPGLRVKFPWRLVVGHHCWLAEDAIQRLQQARVRTRLSTEELLALTRGEDP